MALLIFILVVSAVVYILAICPRGFGAYHDDGIYVTVAKALATGRGYRVISLPGDPLDTKSPPVYPLLLSLVWRLNPSFPENLAGMMGLSVVAALIFLVLTWLYFTRFGYAPQLQASLIVALAALNWRTVVVGSGVYSELFYGVFAIGALVLAEEHERNGGRRTTGLCLGVLIGLAFLTRTSGLAIVLAVAGYFLLCKKGKTALFPIGVAMCFVGAWGAWAYLHRPALPSQTSAYYESYLRTFWTAIGGPQGVSHALTSVVVISGKNVLMLLPISVPVLLIGLPYDWPSRFGSWSVIPGLCLFVIVFGLTVVGFVRTGFRRSSVRLLHLYIIAYVVVHAFWPYRGYVRFLMPLLPFFMLFCVAELDRLVGLVLKEMSSRQKWSTISAALVAMVLLSVAAAGLFNYARGLGYALGSLKDKSATRASEDMEAIDWIKANTNPADVLVSYSDLLYYLHTGRKTARSFPLLEGDKLEIGDTEPADEVNAVFRIIRESGANYLVFTSNDMELERDPDKYREAYKKLLDENPDRFVAVFNSADGHSVIYRINDQGS